MLCKGSMKLKKIKQNQMRGPQNLESTLGVKAQWYTHVCLGPEKRFWVQTQIN